MNKKCWAGGVNLAPPAVNFIPAKRRRFPLFSGIAAVLIDDSAALKRVYHIPNGLQLLSDNAAKHPLCGVTYPDHDSIRILGRAVSYKRLL